jgi:hypothetical protein
MIDPHTPHPTAQREDHQTVIKFVLSGPILGGHETEVAAIVPPPAEVAELRERMTALERALADADARIDALSRALAATVASVAATPSNSSSRRTERAARAPEPPAKPVAAEPPAPEPISYEPPAPEPILYEPPAPEPIPYEPPAPVALAPEPFAPDPTPFVAPPAIRMPEPEPEPEPAHAIAIAARPELAALALVAQPATRMPALRSSHPTPPKVRALRRVIAVLKHL